MGLISDIHVSIGHTLQNYVQDIFTGVADPIRALLNAMALIALMFMGVNQLIQFKPVNYSQYLHWGLRYILIYSFATIWANFSGIYNIFIEIPSDYSALLIKTVALKFTATPRPDILDPSVIKDTYSAMDEFGHAIIWMAHDYFRDVSIWNIGSSIRNVFLGALILIIGGIFLGASAILVIASEIGLAVSISLAPLAIVMLMTEQTKNYFESWMRLTIGFVVIPLLTTAMMSLVLYVAANIFLVSAPNSDDKSSFFPFIFVMIAALYLLFQLPTMASTLASASVAVVGAGAAGFLAMRAPGMAFSAAQRVRDGAGVANQARKAGAGPAGIAWAAISGMRQSAATRNGRRDQRLANRMPGSGNNSPAHKRDQPSPGSRSSSQHPSAKKSAASKSAASQEPQKSSEKQQASKNSSGTPSGGNNSPASPQSQRNLDRQQSSNNSSGTSSGGNNASGNSPRAPNVPTSRQYRQSSSGGSSDEDSSGNILTPEQQNLLNDR